MALLEDMVVEPPRPGGPSLGFALLAQAVRHARAQGCLRLTLLTDADSASVQRFYQRHGFTRSAMIPLRRLLGD